MVSTEHRRAPLSVGLKALYGVGQLAEGVVTITLLLFVLFYYNQVLGLSGQLAGLALFIALLFDALFDPFMGVVSDATRSRLGRRHPYLYLAILPLPIAFYFLFTPPAGADQLVLFVWLTAFSVLTRCALTIFFVPHLALGAELTSNYADRNEVVAYRLFFSMSGYLATLVVGFGLFFVSTPAFENGQFNPSAYAPFAATLAVLLALSMFISAIGTQRLAQPSDNAPAAVHSGGFIAVWRDFVFALRNRSFRFLMFGLLIFYVAYGARSSLGLHVYAHYWGLSSAETQLVSIAGIFALVFGVVIWAVFGRFMEKRTGFLLGYIGWVVFTVVPPLQNMLGLYPPRGDAAYVGIQLWSSIAANLMGAGANVFVGSMIADCLDEHELQTGRRQEGAFFGAFTLTLKATTGLGAWIGGLTLDLIAFPANAAPGTVPPATLQHFSILIGPALLVASLPALFVFLRYDLNRARHAAIQATLQAVERDASAIAISSPAQASQLTDR